SDALNVFGLGGLTVATSGTIDIAAPLNFSAGANVALYAPTIDIATNIIARGGSVLAGNIGPAFGDLKGAGTTQVILRSGAMIDPRGLWTNAELAPPDLSGLAFVDGGSVRFDSTGSVTLETGSLIDASSGGAILADGKTVGGRGGDVSLIADD